MDIYVDFFVDNWPWFLLGGIVLLMTLIGYIAEKTDFGRKEVEKKVEALNPVKKEVKQEENLISIDDFAKVELVVGTVEKCEKHPEADRLLVSQINIGKETRQIVSGIADHYTPEEMIGKKVIVVANLKPAKLRGVESQGMILAGSKKKLLELVSVESLPNGTKIR